mmetsp:Transcript_9351/g.12864  ORF Transcript_9351/g.12864 Transcript_9351/m.12864 type:complete len:214 (+) Transcript_9351:37-678(+)
MDYLFYEAFESEAWEMASTVIIIFGLFFVAISSYAHFYSIAFVTCDVVLPDPVRKLNREEFIYYGFSLFVLLPTGVSVLIFNPDNSLKTCDWLLRAALFYLFIGNFLLYRLLITKSLIYDPMQQMRTLYQLTWWIIHLLYLPLSLYGVASGFIFQREKKRDRWDGALRGDAHNRDSFCFQFLRPCHQRERDINSCSPKSQAWLSIRYQDCGVS